jgi:hypothetical protein
MVMDGVDATVICCVWPADAVPTAVPFTLIVAPLIRSLVKTSVTFPSGAVTVNVTELDTLAPAELTAVIVYVVVELGETERLPLDPTEPIPLLMETEVELETDQDSVADCPAEVEVGLTVKELITGAAALGAVTVNVTDADTVAHVELWAVIV